MKDQRKVAAAALWLAAALITGCAEMPPTGREPQRQPTGVVGSAPSEADDGTQALLDASSDASSNASSPGEAAPRLAPGAAPHSRGAVTRWASGRKGGDGEGSGPRFATHATPEKPRPEPPALNIEKLRGTETLPAGKPDAEPVEVVPPADEGTPAEVDSTEPDAPPDSPAEVDASEADASPDSPAEVLPEGAESGEGQAKDADQAEETDPADKPGEEGTGKDLDSLLKDLDDS